MLSAKEIYTTPLSTCTSTSFISSLDSERVRLLVRTMLSESLLLFTSTRWRIYWFDSFIWSTSLEMFTLLELAFDKLWLRFFCNAALSFFCWAS